ncbi:hypothetical protein BJX99DRAFT_246505 [Aspergillus californicus]
MSSQIPCLGAEPAAEVAEVLDTAKISYICFGWLSLALLAWDANIGEVEIVVRDKDFEAAREALSEAGFRLCDKEDCIQLRDRRVPLRHEPAWTPMGWNRDDGFHIVPEAHFHLEMQYDNCTVLSLYKKSSLLRRIRVLEDEPEDDDPTLVWLSNDCSRLPEARADGPSGPWTQLHPVRILDPTLFCEVLLFIMCRDCGRVGHRSFGCLVMWEKLVWKQMRLNRPLRPDFQLICDIGEDLWVRGIRKRCPYKFMRVCRKELIANGELRPEEMTNIVEDYTH